MKLFLCEKPSQARDIGKVLGVRFAGANAGYMKNENGTVCVTWAVGHLVEQFEPHDYDEKLKQWSLETIPFIPTEWKVRPVTKTKTQFKVVEKLLKQAKTVVIATDIDREGEMIARELLDLVKFKGEVQRLWLSALDEESIRSGLSKIKNGAETLPLYYAGLARSRADWLLGLNFTRLYTLLAQQKGYQGVMSVGRVQTPTLALVVKRDNAIADFKPVQHYRLMVQLAKEGCEPFAVEFPMEQVEQHLNIDGLCLKSEPLNAIAQQLQNAGAVVTQVEQKRKKETPPLCFSLSRLQSECNKRFGYGVSEVLALAQSLYEKHKLTTYPRTDCDYLPLSQHTEAEKIAQAVSSNWSQNMGMMKAVGKMDFSQQSRVWNDAKITAHHAIIPTGTKVDLSTLTEQERAVYQLICQHYVAQFLPLKESNELVVQFECAGFQLVAKGKQVVQSGWSALFGENNNDIILPPLRQGETCVVNEAEVKALLTTPPPHFTEGTLINAMVNIGKTIEDETMKKVLKETEGLGTEATRASVIAHLFHRGLLKRKGKTVIATPEGKALIANLPQAITDPVITAMWESKLNAIAKKEVSLNDFLATQQQFLLQIFETEKRSSGMNLQGVKIKQCPECGKALIKRKGANGEFYGCRGYPECRYTEEITKKTVKKKTAKS